nr:putative copia-type protein [Tanacetum cinerariifolium]
YFTLVGGKLVSWRSKKQKVVALLSAEAEFRVISRGITELIEGTLFSILVNRFTLLIELADLHSGVRKVEGPSRKKEIKIEKVASEEVKLFEEMVEFMEKISVRNVEELTIDDRKAHSVARNKVNGAHREMYAVILSSSSSLAIDISFIVEDYR